MSFYWREAGMNYLKYSNIAASALRSVIKGDGKLLAAKRGESILKIAQWTAGKQGETKFIKQVVQ